MDPTRHIQRTLQYDANDLKRFFMVEAKEIDEESGREKIVKGVATGKAKWVISFDEIIDCNLSYIDFILSI